MLFDQNFDSAGFKPPVPSPIEVRTMIRRFTSPLLQMAGIAFDAELEVDRQQSVEFTERRVAAGVSLRDHSFAQPRQFSITGAVSDMAQIQNFGRPGSNLIQGALDAALGAAEDVTGFDLSSRVIDFEKRFRAMVLRREEVEVISKVIGRVKAVILNFDAMSSSDQGEMAIFRVRLREVQRAGLTFSQATESSMSLTGSGGLTPPGSGGSSSLTSKPLKLFP